MNTTFLEAEDAATSQLVAWQQAMHDINNVYSTSDGPYDFQTNPQIHHLGLLPVALPIMDALAENGFLYTHAYANAPVCAPARNTIITGVYANSNGNQHMRDH